MNDDQILINIYNLIQKRKRNCQKLTNFSTNGLRSIDFLLTISIYLGFLLLWISALIIYTNPPIYIEITYVFGFLISFHVLKKPVVKIFFSKKQEWQEISMQLNNEIVMQIKKLTTFDLNFENAENFLSDAINDQFEFTKVAKILGFEKSLEEQKECLKILKEFRLLFIYKLY